MEWHHPERLYLILPLCAAWLVLALYSERRRQRAREAFVAHAMWSRILPDASRLRFWSKLVLREIAIVMGLVALAGPQFGTQYEQVVPRGSDLYVMIDVSRSMLADDVPPSRLGRAKADVSSLLNRLEGERVGLIAFAGQAVVKCPLTIDYDSFRRALEELDPNSAPRGGTAIGDAIRKALEVFHAKADRDQAILLITDGDDQQSYPLEAAAIAAERSVTIFTVGLGDTDQGARIPQKENSQAYVEYKGEQVWSKLDSSLLEQIALKTSGVYVPAGTRAYELGELYTNHLHGKRGSEAASQQRVRRSEQFQWFLALSVAALLIDLSIAAYRRTPLSPPGTEHPPERPRRSRRAPAEPEALTPVSTALLSVALVCSLLVGTCETRAAEPATSVRDGLRLYSQEEYDEARAKFSAAVEELDRQKSAASATAAFDEACAWHRQGELDKAREAYLRAGLSQDRSIATAAHFNLGNLSAEQARKLAGDHPETVPPDKRQEILDPLMQAIVAYRHCLELQSDHLPSRRNLELVRQWIKYYSDKWRELDRQKRRDESNLIQFLEYLIQAQTALRETVNNLSRHSSADAFAALRQAQDELREEIPVLRDKIESELRPPQSPSASGAPNPDPKDLDEGIKLLQEWADQAGDRMRIASRELGVKQAPKSAQEQQAAIDELDKIWEALIPFHPLLAKDLAEQTVIAKSLNPVSDNEQQLEQPNADNVAKPDQNELEEPAKNPQPAAQKTTGSGPPRLEIDDANLSELAESQERTLKKTRLLAPKAEAELQRLENSPAPEIVGNGKPDDPTKAPQPQVDPEQMKAGYRKAIELAPKAVEQMEAAANSLRQKDRPSAAQQAEAARKILEEIQQAQPRNEPQDKQDKQQNDDQKSQQENKPDEKQKQDEQKSEDQKSDQQQDEKPQQQKPQPQVSHDRVEDALRKVRERQQEKRERDRKFKAQVFGRTPVDKDW